MPFIVKSIYFTEDVLNIDIRSNEDLYNRYNEPLLDTIRISYKDECYIKIKIGIIKKDSVSLLNTDITSYKRV